MNWRILISGKMSPEANMALDETLLDGVEKGFSPPTIRFYDWDPPTVTFGYHQDIFKEVDIDAVVARGYGLMRRPTGGRLVLHKNEVTYSIAAPLEGRFTGNVLAVYREISQVLARGLQQFGIAVELEKGSLTTEEQRQVSNPCFSSSSRYELSFEHRKLVGSAQVRRTNVFLQHGSILLTQNQAEVAQLLPGLTEGQRQRLARLLAQKTVCISEIASRPVSFTETVNALIAGFKEMWTDDTFSVETALKSEEEQLLGILTAEKYGLKQWTYGTVKKSQDGKNNLT
jgi:lipoate-protein ligase A